MLAGYSSGGAEVEDGRSNCGIFESLSWNDVAIHTVGSRLTMNQGTFSDYHTRTSTGGWSGNRYVIFCGDWGEQAFPSNNLGFGIYTSYICETSVIWEDGGSRLTKN